MKMILKLLITSDLWLEVIDLNNANHIKKRNRQRSNACSMTSYKIVGLVHIKR